MGKKYSKYVTYVSTLISIIRSGLIHTHHLENIKQEAHITLMSKILSYQPEPSWPSIVQLLLSHEMKVAKLIILNFGAFVPGQVQNPTSTTILKPMSNGCKGFQCKKKCIGPADHTWPQAIGSGVVKIVLSGNNLKKFTTRYGKILNLSISGFLVKMGNK